MSILIKMEMPKNCGECKLSAIIPIGDYDTYSVCPYLHRHIDGYDITRRTDCPLIEVPKHGRLIDADALRLLYDFNGYEPTGDMTEEEFDRLMCRLPVIRANIDDAPTIIEAEGEDD